MANNFRRKLSRSVGASAEIVGNYTVGAGNTAVIVGLTVTNITGSAIAANVFLNNQTNNTSLVVNGPISSGSSLVIVGGDQKVVLEAGDRIYVQSSAASSVDVIMSILEIS